MKNRFENILIKNLEQQHLMTNKEVIWKGIEQKLNKNRFRKRVSRFAIAASIIVLLGFSLFYINLYHTSQSGVNYYCKINNELSETEFYYTFLINQKETQINSEQFDRQFFKPFFDRITEIDRQYEIYKKELLEYGYQEQMIRAMIELQQQKTEVLNRLLTEINKIKNHENRKKNQFI